MISAPATNPTPPATPARKAPSEGPVPEMSPSACTVADSTRSLPGAVRAWRFALAALASAPVMVTPEPASAVPHTPGRPDRDPRSRPALLACVALLLLFGTLSVSAVRNKCATIDEPLHATGAFLHVFHGDQRINPEDPPLWKYWAMLPHRQWSLNIDRGLEDFSRTLDDTTYQSRFSAVTMYLTPGNDGGRFVDTSRRVMVVLGVALAALTGAWAWRLAGPVAGVVAGALLCLDPNFIAHAPLLKNDVAVSLMFLATAVAAWDVGRRASGWNVALLALLCGASAATKFSGLLVAPILVLMLLARATLVREPWPLGRRAIESTGARLGLALGVCAACAVAAVLVIWASYGFRFAPTSDPDV